MARAIYPSDIIFDRNALGYRQLFEPLAA